LWNPIGLEVSRCQDSAASGSRLELLARRSSACVNGPQKQKRRQQLSRAVKAALAAGVVTVQCARWRKGARRFSSLRGAKAARRAMSSDIVAGLLGEKKAEKDPSKVLEEELQAIRESEEQKLNELEQKLQSSGVEATEEDRRLDALRRQQEFLIKRVRSSKSKDKSVQSVNAVSTEPAEGAGVPSCEAAEQQQPPSPPDPWQLVWADDAGKWYYWNRESGTTSWEPPFVYEKPVEPEGPWQLVLFAATGQWYYHNVETDATSWTFPSDAVAASVADDGAAVAKANPATDSPEVAEAKKEEAVQSEAAESDGKDGAKADAKDVEEASEKKAEEEKCVAAEEKVSEDEDEEDEAAEEKEKKKAAEEEEAKKAAEEEKRILAEKKAEEKRIAAEKKAAEEEEAKKAAEEEKRILAEKKAEEKRIAAEKKAAEEEEAKKAAEEEKRILAEQKIVEEKEGVIAYKDAEGVSAEKQSLTKRKVVAQAKSMPAAKRKAAAAKKNIYAAAFERKEKVAAEADADDEQEKTPSPEASWRTSSRRKLPDQAWRGPRDFRSRSAEPRKMVGRKEADTQLPERVAPRAASEGGRRAVGAAKKSVTSKPAAKERESGAYMKPRVREHSPPVREHSPPSYPGSEARSRRSKSFAGGSRRKDFRNMRKGELVRACKEVGVVADGSTPKEDLVIALQAHFGVLSSSSDEESS